MSYEKIKRKFLWYKKDCWRMKVLECRKIDEKNHDNIFFMALLASLRLFFLGAISALLIILSFEYTAPYHKNKVRKFSYR